MSMALCFQCVAGRRLPGGLSACSRAGNAGDCSAIFSHGNVRNGSFYGTQLSIRRNSSSSSVRTRPRLVRAATVEEIEAEKQAVEEDAMERMEKTLETVRTSFNTVRTGRASPALMDRVEVEYYGSMVILKSIAQITTPDGSTILIQPFDRSSLSAIDKAIQKSDLGLTPNNDGSVIRLSIPQLTSDRRKELLKLVAKLAEDGKVALRNVRRDAIRSYEKLEKDKKISIDNANDLTDDMQKLTDEYVKKVDETYKQKERELLAI